MSRPPAEDPSACLEAPGVQPVPELVRHRTDVVRRLLDRGLSPRVLEALLPDWAPLIAEASGAQLRERSLHTGRPT